MKITWRDYFVAVVLAIILCVVFYASRTFALSGPSYEIIGEYLFAGLIVGSLLSTVFYIAKKTKLMFFCIAVLLIAWAFLPLSNVIFEVLLSVFLGAGVVCCLALIPWIAQKISHK